jgi:HEAT repeat protein
MIAPSAVSDIGERLADDHEMVRRTAIGVLAVRPGPEAEAMLIDALDGRLTIDEKADLLRYLGERGTPRSIEVLEKLAKRRFALTSGARTLRSAARQALGVTK